MPAQLLRGSPLLLKRHEFLDIELHAAANPEKGADLPLNFRRLTSSNPDNERDWRVDLSIRFGGETDGKHCIYSGFVRVVGSFEVHSGYPQPKIHELIEVTAASILYGACREMVANLTARAAHGIALLPAVTFVPVSKEPTLEKSVVAELPESLSGQKSASKTKPRK